jgi:hypothetical protein
MHPIATHAAPLLLFVNGFPPVPMLLASSAYSRFPQISLSPNPKSGIRNPQSEINLKRLADAEEKRAARSRFAGSAIEFETVIEAQRNIFDLDAQSGARGFTQTKIKV